EGRLSAAGYRVLLAEGGEQALTLFAAERCDLVLLDVLMPGLDGFETLDRLRRLPRGSEVAVVFLTALDDVATHERALKAGVDDYLPKPVRATELLIRVRSLLRVGQAMSSLRSSHAVVSAQRDELIRGRDLRRQLSSFIVHDLKSPLNMVMAATDMVKRKQPESAETLTIVQRSAANMLRMVHNLLDLARSEDGRLIARPSDVDVRALVEEQVAEMRGARGEWHHAIQLETQYRIENTHAWVDPLLLRRVLDNLLDNALRYSPLDAAIRIEVSKQGRELELVVRDEGPGIPAADRERVFEMYARLDETHPTRVGHGLGLVFCRLAIEAQGGRVWAEGGPDGVGAAFHVVLPSS
ncbi:MAG TPA: ATP-binding protein, partial [Polyangiales bacterium]|nr:ATP-binding protein [Polyangiales bacterium]